jgi:RNA polymerase sigma-70 factor, ECF subfamily
VPRAGRTAAETDWRQIAMLYEALATLTPSPVVELNRAVAVAMAGDTEQGLRIVNGLAAAPALAGYHHLPSVRGDLLARLGRHGEAAGEFRRAAALTRNGPERTVLLRRADDCDAGVNLPLRNLRLRATPVTSTPPAACQADGSYHSG